MFTARNFSHRFIGNATHTLLSFAFLWSEVECHCLLECHLSIHKINIKKIDTESCAELTFYGRWGHKRDRLFELSLLWLTATSHALMKTSIPTGQWTVLDTLELTLKNFDCRILFFTLEIPRYYFFSWRKLVKKTLKKR